jgi:hypothetical protein
MRFAPKPAPVRSSHRSLLPKAHLDLEALESRLVPYTIGGNAWPHPQLVTISFVPDGTNLGGVSSNLFATLNAKWATSVWQNQILRAAQVWAQQANLNFSVVSDSGAPIGSGTYEQGDPTMGDIRIGGYNFGSNTLASAYQPPPVNSGSIAGDIQFNTGQVFNIGSTYDLFTVAAHEFGHALGLYHSTVLQAEMYGAYTGIKSNLNADDIAGIQAIYGARPPDAYDAGTGKGTFQTAVDITAQINPTSLTALANNLDIVATSDLDYFKFTVPTGTNGNLAVTVQSSGLSLLAPTLTIYNASQAQQAFVSGARNYGTTITASLTSVRAGPTYYIKVAGADTSAFGTGDYALSLNFGSGSTSTATSPTTATLTTTATVGGGLPDKIGEFLVNTATGYQEQKSATAMAPNGRSVVVWQSQNQDGSGHWGIYAQRYTAKGAADGGEFRVNTWTQDDQMTPSVAMASDGSFVIAWQSKNQDGNGWGVYAQRYDANGNPLGGEFLVNTYTNNDQMAPSVAVAPDGSFVIAWQSNGQDGSGWGVYAQRYDSNGNPLGGEFRVNTYIAGDQTSPKIAMAGDDSFVITWQSNNQDGNGWGAYAQRYDANGNALGGEFRVNTTTVDQQQSPSIGMAGDGSFVIAWQSHNQDGAGWGVYAQRYDANGNPLGGEFRVNTYTQDDQMAPSIAMAADGHFVIAWESHNQDGNGWGVYAQRYDANGVAQGSEFRVNTTTVNDQMAPSAAMAADGRFFITWQSNNQVGNGWGVFGQRYDANGDLDLSGGEGDAFSAPNQNQATAYAGHFSIAGSAPHSQFGAPGTQLDPGILPARLMAAAEQIQSGAVPVASLSALTSIDPVVVLGLKVLATARLFVSSRPNASSINPFGGESAEFSFDAEDATDDGASSNELILGPPGQSMLEEFVRPSIARPGESTLQEKMAAATWQRACDACFAEAVVSIGCIQESGDPIPANCQEGETAPLVAAGTVALLQRLVAHRLRYAAEAVAAAAKTTFPARAAEVVAVSMPSARSLPPSRDCPERTPVRHRVGPFWPWRELGPLTAVPAGIALDGGTERRGLAAPNLVYDAGRSRQRACAWRMGPGLCVRTPARRLGCAESAPWLAATVRALMRVGQTVR